MSFVSYMYALGLAFWQDNNVPYLHDSPNFKAANTLLGGGETFCPPPPWIRQRNITFKLYLSVGLKESTPSTLLLAQIKRLNLQTFRLDLHLYQYTLCYVS